MTGIELKELRKQLNISVACLCEKMEWPSEFYYYHRVKPNNPTKISYEDTIKLNDIARPMGLNFLSDVTEIEKNSAFQD